MLSKRNFLIVLAAVVALAVCAFAIPAHAASFIPGDALGSLGSLGALAGVPVFGAIGSTVAEHFADKSKFFRIAVEGATTDGREIPREWIEQAAKNYNRDTYGARLNLEHLRGVLPDGPFKAYGDVLELKAEEIEINGVKKLALFARIEPTPALIEMTKAKQKIYTSCEFAPQFADMNGAYLVGLAVTDSPASLGTEILAFSAKHPAVFASRKQAADNLFTAAEETVIEFEAPAAPSLFAKVKDLIAGFSKKAAGDESRFADVSQAVELLATHNKEQADVIAAQGATIAQLSQQLTAATETVATVSKDFAQLKEQLASTGNGQPARPQATGGNSAIKTDC